MRLGRGIFIFVSSFAASVVLTIACGPGDKNSAIIHQNGGGGVASASNQCAAKIGHYQARVDEKSVNAKGKIPAARLCAATGVDPHAYAKAADQPLPRPAYKATDEVLRFTVRSDQKRLAVALKIGLLFPNGTPGETADAILRKIKNVCLSPLQKAWTAGAGDVDLELGLAAIDPDMPDAADQTIELVAADDNLGLASRPVFVMAMRPDRGQLNVNPLLPANCGAECRASLAPKTYGRFCTAFALAVAEHLGLGAQESATDTCTATPAPVAGDQILTGGFMKAEGLQADPGQFWKRARFSTEDFKTITTPACDGKASVTPVPTPTPPDDQVALPI